MKQGLKEEKWVADFLGGKLVVASGAIHRSSDVIARIGDKTFLIEVKMTRKPFFNVTRQLWDTVKGRAILREKEPMLVVVFKNCPQLPLGRKAVCLFPSIENLPLMKEIKIKDRRSIKLEPSSVGMKISWNNETLVCVDFGEIKKYIARQ